MASLEFTKRFQNKAKVVGRDGILAMHFSNAIEKTELPVTKIHGYQEIKGIPTAKSAYILNKYSPKNRSPLAKVFQQTVYQTPNCNLTSNKTPGPYERTLVSRSKSPILLKHFDTFHDKTSNDLNLQYFKFPRINSGMKCIKKRLDGKIKFLGAQ
ncbi:hypothetical protein SteCoe_36249 [Stentor coeruleus]|uniref:Uncharacterized protein n=1 Tax=Stentor coeruleus TaxID=5963 RepID=A0A1R2AQJ9_9CILI|nr:hypothetical protein SteCoe_36249 [Stentor coeruleus]